MCYTSGTTGNPKGVAYLHRSNYLHSMGVAATLGITAADRLLIVVPLFHLGGRGAGRQVGRATARLGRAQAGHDDDGRGAPDFLESTVAHWQVPERWAVIDEVPKTSVGKFDKKVLRRRYAEGELEVSTVR